MNEHNVAFMWWLWWRAESKSAACLRLFDTVLICFKFVLRFQHIIVGQTRLIMKLIDVIINTIKYCLIDLIVIFNDLPESMHCLKHSSKENNIKCVKFFDARMFIFFYNTHVRLWCITIKLKMVHTQFFTRKFEEIPSNNSILIVSLFGKSKLVQRSTVQIFRHTYLALVRCLMPNLVA